MKNTDFNLKVPAGITAAPAFDMLQDIISDLGLEVESVISL